MIRHIIRKELLVNLLSLRFAVGLVVVALMMGLVGYVLMKDYAVRHQTYLSDMQRHQEEFKKIKVYSMLEVVVDIPPSPLSVFSRSVKDRPNSIRVSPYQIPSLISEEGTDIRINLGGTSNRPYNPLLRIFTPIDLAFVISIIMSLFAILLVFDSFSGEREQGTLKLIMACPIKRVHLLIGKFIGALLTLAVPLTLGFLEVMLLWSFSSDISLDAASWAGIGTIYLFSLIFLSGFLALGLFVSLFATEASSGFMYLLLVWVIVAIVIPEGGGYLADYIRPRQSQEQVLKEIKKVREEFGKTYTGYQYQPKCEWWWGSITSDEGESFLGITEDEVYNRVAFNKKIFPLKFRLVDECYRIIESYALALRKWSRIRDDITRPSLSVLYRNVVQAIAGTDIGSYDIALRRARLYREALMSYLQPKGEAPEWVTRALEYPDMQPTEQNQKYWKELEKKGGGDWAKNFNWDRVVPLDLSAMPQPRIEFPGLAERIEQVMVDVLLLIGSIALFLILSAWRVLRYNVH